MSSITPVTVAEALSADNAGGWHVVDTAFNLLSTATERFGAVASVTLIGVSALSFRQFEWLRALPGFVVGPTATVRLADSLANISAGAAAHPEWLAEVTVLDVLLEDGRIDAAPASWLAGLQTPSLAVVFTPYARTIADAELEVTPRAPDGEAKLLSISAGELLASGLYGEAGRMLSAHRGHLTVTNASVSDLEVLADLPLADTAITVSDSGATLSADLALRGSSAILALLPHITAIEATDGGVVSLTAAQALTGGVDDGERSALALTSGGALAVTDARITQLSQIGRLPVAPISIAIRDSADAVITSLAALLAQGGHTRVTLSDGWVHAAQVPPLMLLGDILTAGVPVRDSGFRIAELATHHNEMEGAFLAANGAVLARDSIVSVADIRALASLTSFSKGGRTLAVWDNADEISAGAAHGFLSGQLADGIFLRTVDGSVALTAAAAAALFAVPGFCAANPDGTANSVTVSDSAAEIEALHRPLAGWANMLNRIEVNANATVSMATLGRLQALGAVPAAGTSLTVRDDAATIAGAAEGGAPSIAPAAWILSGSAVITVSDGVALARRAHFSAAPYVLTLASDAVVAAAEARALSALGSAFNTGGHKLTVRDTAANLVEAVDAGVSELATSLTLSGQETVRAAAAETLLQIAKFRLTSTLTIVDHAANLRSPTLRAALTGRPSDDIHVRLGAAEAVNLDDAGALGALPGFADPAGNLTIVALPPRAPSDNGPMVTLGAGETVFVSTILRLSDDMGAGGDTLGCAGAGGEAAASKAVAEIGAHIAAGGRDCEPDFALASDPSEFASLRAESMPPGNHIAAAVLAHAGVTGSGVTGGVTGTGSVGGTVNVYGESGSLLSETVERYEGFTVSAPETGEGHAFSITESVDGQESAPVVVLDGVTLEGAVSAAQAHFPSSGAIEVSTGKYLDLYTAGGVPALDGPALVYDPGAHSIALNIPGHAAVPLIVLGVRAPPASIGISEILVRKAS